MLTLLFGGVLHRVAIAFVFKGFEQAVVTPFRCIRLGSVGAAC